MSVKYSIIGNNVENNLGEFERNGRLSSYYKLFMARQRDHKMSPLPGC